MKCIFIYSNILSDGVVSKLLVYELRLEFTIVKKLLSVVFAEPPRLLTRHNSTCQRERGKKGDKGEREE
jgi:hypothetical protein